MKTNEEKSQEGQAVVKDEASVEFDNLGKQPQVQPPVVDVDTIPTKPGKSKILPESLVKKVEEAFRCIRLGGEGFAAAYEDVCLLMSGGLPDWRTAVKDLTAFLNGVNNYMVMKGEQAEIVRNITRMYCNAVARHIFTGCPVLYATVNTKVLNAARPIAQKSIDEGQTLPLDAWEFAIEKVKKTRQENKRKKKSVKQRKDETRQDFWNRIVKEVNEEFHMKLPDNLEDAEIVVQEGLKQLVKD